MKCKCNTERGDRRRRENKINFYCDKLGPPRSEYFMKPQEKKAKNRPQPTTKVEL